MSENSKSSIVALSRSRKRYKHQDQLLLGFLKMPGSTAKEIAVELYDWKYDDYADSQKRASDLASDKLQYIEACGSRVCRFTGNEATVYRITERGIEHLRKEGLYTTPVQPAKIDSNARAKFADLAANLR